MKIANETFGAPSGQPLLLVMGLGVQMLYWPDDFCAAPADAGFAVTRFDNRDTGLSTRFSTAGVGPSYRQPDQRRLSGRW